MTTLPSIDLKDFHLLLAPRLRDANKGAFGHVLIVGGDRGTTGAVLLAGKAALRTGAGLVTIATRSTHMACFTSACPELMVHGIETADDLAPLLLKATVIVIGPGLGQSDWAKALLKMALTSTLPTVIDADALNLLAQSPCHSDQWILTPHPGEAARLLACPVAAIQADRNEHVQLLQQAYGGVVVLKGQGSLVCSDHSLSICQAGNPGMATGGMGDVLSGVIGALLAQGLNLQQAAELGVCVHASAGDLAAQALGERGLIASDLMPPFLQKLVNLS